MSELERTLATHLKWHKLPAPKREYRFHLTRKWKFDFAWPDAKVACEVEGGVWAATPGRHNRGSGFVNDCEKYSLAAIDGWCVIRVTDKHINSGQAIEWIRTALETRAESGRSTIRGAIAGARIHDAGDQS